MKRKFHFAILMAGMLLIGSTASRQGQAATVAGLMDQQSNAKADISAENRNPGKVKKTMRGSEKGVKDTGEGVARGADEAMNGTADGAKDASKATAKGGKNATNATAKGVRDTGKATGKAVKKVGKVF